MTIRTGVPQGATRTRFSGPGERALPPFVLRRAKTMYWRNAGSLFEVFPADQASARGDRQHRSDPRREAPTCWSLSVLRQGERAGRA